jgi:hypothetical protein
VIILADEAIHEKVGGLSATAFGISCPFEIALALMIVSTAYSTFFLPYIAPDKTVPTTDSKTTGGAILNRMTSFLSPLKAFVPRRVTTRDGRTSRYYGVFFLGSGVFLGVVSVFTLDSDK